MSYLNIRNDPVVVSMNVVSSKKIRTLYKDTSNRKVMYEEIEEIKSAVADILKGVNRRNSDQDTQDFS